MWQFKYLKLSPADRYLWDDMLTELDWLHLFEDIPQEPEYHGEGNVLVHTRMVLDSLMALKEWKTFNEKEKNILFIAALIHDIGKTTCTKYENGRITSPRHTTKGAKQARILMWKGIPDPVPFHIREQIVHLIKRHSLPLWFLEEDHPESVLIKASQTTNLKLLSTLAKADVMGRVCKDQKDLIEKIDLFVETTVEMKCYHAPYPFPSSCGRFEYFTKPEASPLYKPYENFNLEVILMSGLPGAGKDYWIEQNAPDQPMISLDDIRKKLNISPAKKQHEVILNAKEAAKDYLRKKTSFIWNATNITREMRKQLIDLFTAYGARVKIIYIEPNYDTLLLQNKNRDKAIPNPVLNHMIQKLDVPDIFEAHDVLYITKQ